MTKIITIEVDTPLWRASRLRASLTPTLSLSTELVVVESWSWLRPLTWRFTVTGPAFQAHKVAGDVQPVGKVHYAAAAAVLALTVLAGPAWAGCNCSRSESAQGQAEASGQQTSTSETLRNWVRGRLRNFQLIGKGKLTTFTPYVSSGADNILGPSDRWSVGVVNFSQSLRERAIIDSTEGTWRGMEGSTGRLYGGV